MDCLEVAKCQLQLLSQQLESSETLIRQLSEKRDALKGRNRELEGLKAGLTTVRTTQQLEGTF